MGIGRGAVKLLIQEAKRRPFSGAILTLGKQDVWITRPQFEALAAESNFSLSPSKGIDPLSQKPELKAQKLLSDRYLFTCLGFDTCKSIDYSPYEGADFLFDLNQKMPPLELFSSFDVVFDGGTLEHIFHLPNALNNIYFFLASQGRIFHISPSSNHIDHGFYMFSPTFFWDFYQANHFEINAIQVIQHTPTHRSPWKASFYVPGCLNAFSYGGLDDKMYAIVCIATKMANSTSNQWPQQRNYSEEFWKKQENSQPDFQSLGYLLKTKIKKYSALYRFFQRALAILKKRKKSKLKFTAKY